MRPRGVDERHDDRMVCENIALGNSEVEVKYVEELALNSADVSLSEDASAERPVDVLERRVIQVLQRGCMLVSRRGCEDREHTLFARIRAPRKTRSQAHCSSAI